MTHNEHTYTQSLAGRTAIDNQSTTTQASATLYSAATRDRIQQRQILEENLKDAWEKYSDSRNTGDENFRDNLYFAYMDFTAYELSLGGNNTQAADLLEEVFREGLIDRYDHGATAAILRGFIENTNATEEKSNGNFAKQQAHHQKAKEWFDTAEALTGPENPLLLIGRAVTLVAEEKLNEALVLRKEAEALLESVDSIAIDRESMVARLCEHTIALINDPTPSCYIIGAYSEPTGPEHRNKNIEHLLTADLAKKGYNVVSDRDLISKNDSPPNSKPYTSLDSKKTVDYVVVALSKELMEKSTESGSKVNTELSLLEERIKQHGKKGVILVQLDKARTNEELHAICPDIFWETNPSWVNQEVTDYLRIDGFATEGGYAASFNELYDALHGKKMNETHPSVSENKTPLTPPPSPLLSPNRHAALLDDKNETLLGIPSINHSDQRNNLANNLHDARKNYLIPENQGNTEASDALYHAYVNATAYELFSRSHHDHATLLLSNVLVPTKHGFKEKLAGTTDQGAVAYTLRGFIEHAKAMEEEKSGNFSQQKHYHQKAKECFDRATEKFESVGMDTHPLLSIGKAVTLSAEKRLKEAVTLGEEVTQQLNNGSGGIERGSELEQLCRHTIASINSQKPSCFVIYAHHESEGPQHRNMTIPCQLIDDLTDKGYNVKSDRELIFPNGLRTNSERYINPDSKDAVNYVVVVLSEELVKKSTNPNAVVCAELNILNERIKERGTEDVILVQLDKTETTEELSSICPKMFWTAKSDNPPSIDHLRIDDFAQDYSAGFNKLFNTLHGKEEAKISQSLIENIPPLREGETLTNTPLPVTKEPPSHSTQSPAILSQLRDLGMQLNNSGVTHTPSDQGKEGIISSPVHSNHSHNTESTPTLSRS